MKLKIYYLTALIAIILSIIAFFFDYTISIGIMTATLASLVNLLLLSASMSMVMKEQDMRNYPLLIMSNIFRYGLLALVIYIAIRNPQYFNIYGVTIGLVLFMVSLVIDALSRKGA
ncbi:MAG: ATP synthase subunit I [Erysipelotrichaceae bacterium]|nr:ATP synthase subunit I [Erysipelotrichaceae bacterium]